MKWFVVLLSLTWLTASQSSTFETEAAKVAGLLKSGLVKNLTEKMAKAGTVEAVQFCHENVSSIAKSAAGDYIQRYEFGRTSHKLRNPKNQPQEWMKSYLSAYQGTSKKDHQKDHFIHDLPDGKKVYVEPLYVQPMCLQCHGEKISAGVEAKVKELYPQDQATGFKLGEFRGFIWVKEK